MQPTPQRILLAGASGGGARSEVGRQLGPPGPVLGTPNGLSKLRPYTGNTCGSEV